MQQRSAHMTDLVVTRLQVIFETAASAAASLGGAPLPVQMHMHGSEGVTPALHFDITQRGGLAVHDCTAQAVGKLRQLTVWVDPAMVRKSSHCFGLPPCWIVLLSMGNAVLNQHSPAITFQYEALVWSKEDYMISLGDLAWLATQTSHRSRQQLHLKHCCNHSGVISM